ncbi:hypothetical protein TVAG_425500 [Trichomonas vaginalis G3]|uniref:Uncharacterized protein n=1 Tax=Trichomonas vaginalis (strain ATCC PRA-98 / G3) TaxID=412133 RepID=A2FI84_TRIV3|nr:hypothetical protein TVAGG3_0723240 [Trichomonas vaginalis G3]EAX95366.1 hypothetical protein TVAG_425500 [Trichomonas vaginalis G3]KAI5510735.1 hypothetical protein TVAGG3_0723240 [Trichomonas vaginalis G3]|eukprot:XP_001308296.1 hypothetical protein [Trichomonas vaginalis G3]
MMMMPIQPEIDTVSIKKPVKFLTHYTSDDISKRINEAGVHVNIVQYVLFGVLGNAFKNTELLDLAVKVSQKLGIYIDRMAKRNKTALLCWFAENWMAIYPYLCSQNMIHSQKHIGNNIIIGDLKQNVVKKEIDPTNVLQLLNHH